MSVTADDILAINSLSLLGVRKNSFPAVPPHSTARTHNPRGTGVATGHMELYMAQP